MKDMKKLFELELGAICDKISEQIKKQKYKFNTDVVKGYQLQSNAIITLWMGGLLTDTMKLKLKKKLFTKVMNHVKKNNP